VGRGVPALPGNFGIGGNVPICVKDPTSQDLVSRPSPSEAGQHADRATTRPVRKIFPPSDPLVIQTANSLACASASSDTPNAAVLTIAAPQIPQLRGPLLYRSLMMARQPRSRPVQFSSRIGLSKGILTYCEDAVFSEISDVVDIPQSDNCSDGGAGQSAECEGSS
jgi:hypothetical protein